MTFGFNIVDLGFYKCTFIVYQYKLTTAVYYIFSCSITCLKKLIKKNYLYQSENITRKYDVGIPTVPSDAFSNLGYDYIGHKRRFCNLQNGKRQGPS